MDLLAGIRLFVYGSLLRGERHHDELAGAKFVREARIAGYAMYELGDYPTLVSSEEGVVSGEIYEVSEQMLAGLDAFEGEGYERGKVTVEGGGSAETYLRSGPLPEGAIRIASGSWRAHRRSLR
ncbi:MAG: gamma-glutamylcyclotransferase [Polyangiaceae bacterium]|nr:gamma-glutamylcyclotransferase [Polyangiaceae bacterium]